MGGTKEGESSVLVYAKSPPPLCSHPVPRETQRSQVRFVIHFVCVIIVSYAN